MSQGEAAVFILQGKDTVTNERNGGAPKWIVFGDLDHMHRIRELAGLPHRSFFTNHLVCDALGKYAAKENSLLAVVAYDKVSHWRYFGLSESAPSQE